MDRLFLLGVFLALAILFYMRSFSNPNSNRISRVLTAIVTTDRDADLAPKFYEAIRNNTSGEILLITREKDIQTQNAWKDKAIIRTVPDYEIKERHNISKIAEKRTLALNYAIENNYSAVWFIDSDIIPTPGVLQELLKTEKDVCVAPYKTRWSEEASVGVFDREPPFVKVHNISLRDYAVKRKPCVIGGFGCTLVKSTAFDQSIELGRLYKGGELVEGEDIGFFMNCRKAGLTCEYLTRWEQPHLYDRKHNSSADRKF